MNYKHIYCIIMAFTFACSPTHCGFFRNALNRFGPNASRAFHTSPSSQDGVIDALEKIRKNLPYKGAKNTIELIEERLEKKYYDIVKRLRDSEDDAIIYNFKIPLYEHLLPVNSQIFVEQLYKKRDDLAKTRNDIRNYKENVLEKGTINSLEKLTKNLPYKEAKRRIQKINKGFANRIRELEKEYGQEMFDRKNVERIENEIKHSKDKRHVLQMFINKLIRANKDDPFLGLSLEKRVEAETEGKIIGKDIVRKANHLYPNNENVRRSFIEKRKEELERLYPRSADGWRIDSSTGKELDDLSFDRIKATIEELKEQLDRVKAK